MKQYHVVSFFIKIYCYFVISAKETSCVNQTHQPAMSSVCLGNIEKPQVPLETDLSTNYYWTEVIENAIDKKKLNFDKDLPTNLLFAEVQPGCGRMQNRLLITDQGQWYCARYRFNIELLQGDFYSYMLSLQLGISNVPPAFIVEVDPTSIIWAHIWADLKQIGWRPNSKILLTRWIDGLRPVSAPSYLLKKEKMQRTSCNIEHLNIEELAFLAQWTDMILFDFLTGNLDRLVTHLYSLNTTDKYAMLHPLHNLAQTKQGFLVFLDNESGFGHSYRLLSKYNRFHLEALDNVCLVRKPTFFNLLVLSGLSPSDLEEKILNQTGISLPKLSQSNIRILKRRLQVTTDHFLLNCALK